MYGPASKGQSVAEDDDNDTVDKKNTSMVVVHPHQFDGKMKLAAPLRDAHGKELASLAKGTVVKNVRKGAPNSRSRSSPASTVARSAGSMRTSTRTIDLVCVLALASCAGAPAPLSDPPPLSAPPHAMTTCTDLSCLQANEGKVIDLEGTFASPPDPKRKGGSQYKLVLADGTEVVLKRDPRLTPALDGKHIAVRGKVYANPGNIPDEYGIVQATPNPYLVELHDVTSRVTP